MTVINSAGMRSDSLGFYLTGASSDGGVQTDPDASLGNYRSSTEVRLLGGIITENVPELIVERVTGDNGVGVGVIRSDGTNIYYTPPGGTEGTGEAIDDGETAILEGADRDKAVRVTRDGAGLKTGSLSLSLVDVFNNPIGMSNIPNADRVAGSTIYRAIMLRPRGLYGVLDIKFWLGTMTGTQSTISIGYEAQDGSGKIQTIADETTAPSGISWSSPTDEASAITISGLDVGENHGLWIRRVFPAGGTVKERELVSLQCSFLGV